MELSKGFPMKRTTLHLDAELLHRLLHGASVMHRDCVGCGSLMNPRPWWDLRRQTPDRLLGRVRRGRHRR